MFVSSSARLIYGSVGNVRTIWSCISHVMKSYVILSPKLNPGIPEGIFIRFIGKCSPKLCIPDAGDDHLEKGETKYFYQKLSRRENIARIIECTGCNEWVAKSMLREYPVLKYVSSNEITKIMKFLNENGVLTETIWTNYWLLTLERGKKVNLSQESEENNDLEGKLGILAELGVSDFNLAVPLLRIPVNKLKRTSYWCKGKGGLDKTKISYLCDRLKCDPADIALAVSVHKFLLTVPFDRMVTILDILLAEGVPPSKILKDMWVFRYRVEQVQKRVTQAKEGGVEQFKTWMVRCTEKILSTTMRIQAEKRTLLGPHNDSMVDYISSRLNVSRVEAQLILRRQPQLRGVGAAKLCNTLDFLLGKEGDPEMGPKFDPIQVWSSSRILCHSLETMKSRLARLRALGHEPKTPAILYKAKRKFEDFVQKLEKQALEKTEDIKTLESGIKKTSQVDKTSINR